MDTKLYSIDFYVGEVGRGDENTTVSQVLHDIHENNLRGVIEQGGMTYEIRDLQMSGNGSSFKGVFAKFRTDDFPHIGEPGGPEEELEVEEHQGLIEKNHFLYFRNRQLLIWQCNRNGSVVGTLAKCLSDIVNETVVFQPVFQPDAVRRLMRGEVTPLSLEFSIARPTNPEMYPTNDWSNSVLQALSQAGGSRVRVKITSDSRSNERERRSLARRVKAAARELSTMDDVKTLRLDVDDDGVKHPINLLEDRIRSHQIVEMNGRYPVVESIYRALRTALDEQRSAIDDFFGRNGNELG